MLCPSCSGELRSTKKATDPRRLECATCKYEGTIAEIFRVKRRSRLVRRVIAVTWLLVVTVLGVYGTVRVFPMIVRNLAWAYGHLPTHPVLASLPLIMIAILPTVWAYEQLSHGGLKALCVAFSRRWLRKGSKRAA